MTYPDDDDHETHEDFLDRWEESEHQDDTQPDCVDCIARTCVGCRFYAGRPEDEMERNR